MTPDLAHPAITEVEDLDTIVVKLLARPLAADRDERDSVQLAGERDSVGGELAEDIVAVRSSARMLVDVLSE